MLLLVHLFWLLKVHVHSIGIFIYNLTNKSIEMEGRWGSMRLTAHGCRFASWLQVLNWLVVMLQCERN